MAIETTRRTVSRAADCKRFPAARPHAIASNTPPLISVIIPCRDQDGTRVLPRLNFLARDSTVRECAEVIVSDTGSPEFIRQSLERVCKSLGFRFLRAADEYRIVRRAERRTGSGTVRSRAEFSPAVARNRGAEVARGKYLALIDADLLPADGLFRRIVRAVTADDFASNINSLLVLPFVYTNKKNSRQFLDTRKPIDALYRIRSGDTGLSIYFPTSAVVVHRTYYLALGGQFEGYRGWGSEDHDFLFKSLFFGTISNRDPQTFAGILSNGRTKGRYSYRFLDHAAAIARSAADRDLYLTHVWHDRKRDTNWWSRVSAKRNANLFHRRCRKSVRNGCIDNPLPNLSARDCIIVGKRELTNDRLFNAAFRRIDHIGENGGPEPNTLVADARRVYVFEAPLSTGYSVAVHALAKQKERDVIVATRLFGPYVLFSDRMIGSLRYGTIAGNRLVSRTLERTRTVFCFTRCNAHADFGASNGDPVQISAVRNSLRSRQLSIRNIPVDDCHAWPKPASGGVALCSSFRQALLAAYLGIPIILTKHIPALPVLIPVCPSADEILSRLERSEFADPCELRRSTRHFLENHVSKLTTPAEVVGFGKIRGIDPAGFDFPFRYSRLIIRGQRLALGHPGHFEPADGSRDWNTID